MSKINDIAKKLDNYVNNIQNLIIRKCDMLETENRVYREEILRLESVVKGLISVIANYEFKKEK